MPRLRFRFTIRRMMIAVAVVAVVCGGAEGLRHRRLAWMKEAARWRLKEKQTIERVKYHTIAEQDYQAELQETQTLQAWFRCVVIPSDHLDAEERLDSTQVDQHHSEFMRWQARVLHRRKMKSKFIQATQRPWLPVASDVPEPE